MNPFSVGKRYSKEHFIDRKNEIDYIKNVLKSGNNLLLTAHRRVGKTWLIKKLIEDIGNSKDMEDREYSLTNSVPNGFEVLYIDLSGIISLKSFAKEIISQSFRILKDRDPMYFFSKYFKNLSNYITFSIKLHNISFDFKHDLDNETLINESYNVISTLSKKLENKLLLIIDEFQEYDNIYKDLPKLLKALSQNEGIPFIISSARHKKIEELFFQSSGILFQSALNINVNTYLPKEDCIIYAQEKFKYSGKNLPRDCGELIYELTLGHPHFFQLMCFEVWNKTKTIVTYEVVERVFAELMEKQSYVYDTLIDHLDLKYAKNVLWLLSQENENIFRMHTIKKYGIPNTSVLNKTLKSLSEYGIVEKTGKGRYRLTDPLLEKYIQNQIAI